MFAFPKGSKTMPKPATWSSRIWWWCVTLPSLTSADASEPRTGLVEVTSPTTAARDRIQKLALYERAGVTEYWIVHPADRVVTARRLGPDDRYGVPSIHEGSGPLQAAVLPGLTLDLDMLFRD